MARKSDPVVECIAAAAVEYSDSLWREIAASEQQSDQNWIADWRKSARRIKRALAKAGFLKDPPHA